MFFRYLSKWDITGFTVFKIDDYTLGNVENSLLWEEKKQNKKKLYYPVPPLRYSFGEKKMLFLIVMNVCLSIV